MGQTRKKNWRKRGLVLDIDMAALRAANQAADDDDEEEEEVEEDVREESPVEEDPMPIPTSTFIPSIAPSINKPTTAPEEAKPDVSMWKMVEDASGKPYYWNQDDNTTSWEPPIGWEFRDKTDEDNNEEQNSSSSDNNNSKTADTNVNNEIEFDDEDQTSAADALLRDLDESSSLSDEWAVTLDPNTGKEYYWNKSTGETSWEPPPKATPSLATTTSTTTTNSDTSTTILASNVPPTTTTTTTTTTTVTENGLPPPSSSIDEKESPKKERKKNKREKSTSRSRSHSPSKEKDKSRSRSVKREKDKDNKKSKKKKHTHHKKKEKEKDRSKKKDSSDNDSDDEKEKQREKEKEKERREQERKKEQERIEREKKKKREKEEEQRREKEREEGLREAEERAAETRTKTIVSALSAGIQARVSSLSKIVGLPDRKIAPLDRFKVELEIRIADWKEGATTSSWALSKLQVLAGQLDGIIAEEKEALRESERQKQEEVVKAQEAARQEREAEKRRRRVEEDSRTHEAASKSDEAVYAPFGASAKPSTAAVAAPPVHPSRLALITKPEQTARLPAKEALRRLPPVAPASPPQASDEEEEEASSSEEELDGVSVTVHQRPSRKNAPVSGDFEASAKKKKRSTTKVFGKQMGALVNKWTKVQKAVDKEARRAEEETSVTGRRAWKAEMEQSGLAAGNANFVELGKRASLTKRRRDDED